MQLAEQAIRFLRERWPNATMLAEELFAFFRSLQDNPLELSQPLTVQSSDNNVPALTVTNLGDNSFAATFGGGGAGTGGGVQIVEGPLDLQAGNFSISEGGITLDASGIPTPGSTGIYMTPDGTLYLNGIPVTADSTGLVLGGGAGITLNDNGSINLGAGGTVNIGGTQVLPATGGGGGGGGGTATGSGLAGTVVGGSGSTYSVSLLPSGPTVTATVIQIDAADTIPAGTGVLISKVDSTYYIQPAVWL